MKRALVVGGANGIGLAIAHCLANREDIEQVIIVDKANVDVENLHPKFLCEVFDLQSPDYSYFNKFNDIDLLMITAGFGKLSLFENIPESMIINSFNVNAVAPIRIIHHFYNRLQDKREFFCGVMVSIAGFMSSPFFSVYGATKAALKIFIESVNVELEKCGAQNRILNVSPGSIKGTSFNQSVTDLSQTMPLADEIISRLVKHDDLFIPQYDEVFRIVLERYHNDFRAEGRHSYEYKIQSGRINSSNNNIIPLGTAK